LLASLRALAGSADELSAESAPASRQWPVPVGRNGERRLATRPARPRAVSLAAAHSRLRRFAVARRKARHWCSTWPRSRSRSAALPSSICSCTCSGGSDVGRWRIWAGDLSCGARLSRLRPLPRGAVL